jgi:hypothetical protein
MDGWTTKQVCRQLSRWGLEEYAESARRAKIDGPAMMALHEVDALCSQLGIVKMGHRKRLAIAIRHLDDDDKRAFKLAIPPLQRSRSSPDVSEPDRRSGRLPLSSRTSRGGSVVGRPRSTTKAYMFGGIAVKCVYDGDVSIVRLASLRFDDLLDAIRRMHGNEDPSVRYVDRESADDKKEKQCLPTAVPKGKWVMVNGAMAEKRDHLSVSSLDAYVVAPVGCAVFNPLHAIHTTHM